jgi:hypothetical protein
VAFLNLCVLKLSFKPAQSSCIVINPFHKNYFPFVVVSFILLALVLSLAAYLKTISFQELP